MNEVSLIQASIEQLERLSRSIASIGETEDYTEVAINAGLNIVKSIINDETQTSTAYDVNKVVKELNKIKKYNLNLADMMLDIQANGTNRHFICLEDAIEIIKAGGNS